MLCVEQALYFPFLIRGVYHLCILEMQDKHFTFYLKGIQRQTGQSNSYWALTLPSCEATGLTCMKLDLISNKKKKKYPRVMRHHRLKSTKSKESSPQTGKLQLE